MVFQKHARVVFIGDSITDCGRARPRGEGRHGELGNGFVALADALLWSGYPERSVHTINMGVGGDSSSDILARWETDVSLLRPDWVVAMAGINDIFRRFFKPDFTETQVPETQYPKNLAEMLRRTHEAGAEMILLSPFYLEPNLSDPVRSEAERYRGECARLAASHGLMYIDVQAVFDRFMQKAHSSIVSLDRLHPNIIGHSMVAQAIYRELETR
jgi:lysophospholipase L1-like esterase